MKNRIKDVKIATVHSDEEYFADGRRFGSTEYSEYLQNREIGLAISIEARSTMESSETGALLFGKAVHLCLQDPSNFLNYTIAKTQSTTPSGFSKGELGIKDYFLLKHFLRAFPLDMKKLMDSSDFYEKEVGYFLDITICNEETELEKVVRFRCKPDLSFRLALDNHLYIVDWKTTSKFAGIEFTKKYLHQGELYANLMYLVTGVDMIQHINYVFEKDHPYRQYDLEGNTYHINESVQQTFLNNALNMQNVRDNHELFLDKNCVLSNEVLKCFRKDN